MVSKPFKKIFCPNNTEVGFCLDDPHVEIVFCSFFFQKIYIIVLLRNSSYSGLEKDKGE